MDMKAEIKAKELVEIYQKQKVSVLYYENSIPSIVHSEMLGSSAIQCAIICVGEIIKEYQSMSDLKTLLVVNDEYSSVVKHLQFWQEVLTRLKAM